MIKGNKLKRLLVPFFALALAFAAAPMAFAAQPALGAGSILNANSIVGAQEGSVDISTATIADIADQVYTGDPIKPAVTVTIGGKTLDNGTDYTVTYANNTNSGTATVTVKGQGDYTGTKSDTFKIVDADASEFDVTAIATQTYTGKAITPNPIVKFNGDLLTAGKDYTVDYQANVNAGTAQVVLKGIGNFTGTKTSTFTIGKASITKASVGKVAAQIYSAGAIAPKPAVKFNGSTLVVNRDYTRTYKANVKAGTAQIVFTGTGNFTGTKTVKFTIAKASMAKVAARIAAQTYAAKALKPAVVTRYMGKSLKKNVDYTVTYSNNVKIGIGKAVLKGKGSFKGTKTVYFKITKANMSKATAKVSAQTYTGKALKPRVTVKYLGKTLLKSSYTITYKNNVNAGIGKVVLKGKGNFTGSKTIKFKINKADIDDVKISTISPQQYTGKHIYPKFKITFNGIRLKNKKDFTLDYDDNLEIGTATINIIGKGNFTGSTTTKFVIDRRSLSDATVSAIAPQRYTGQFIQPIPTVTAAGRTLVNGTDFTLSYDNNVNAGTASVTIYGKGNYRGQQTVNFTIVDGAAA